MQLSSTSIIVNEHVCLKDTARTLRLISSGFLSKVSIVGVHGNLKFLDPKSSSLSF